MGSFSNFLENALINHVFSTAGAEHEYARPTLYIALCTVTVTEAMTGSNITEAGAVGEYGTDNGAYARVICQTWDIASGTDGDTENTVEVEFPTATASWGTILDFAICDASTAGNMLAFGTLSTSKSVALGDTPKFAVGDLDVTLN